MRGSAVNKEKNEIDKKVTKSADERKQTVRGIKSPKNQRNEICS
jgi:hypothetical protein